MKSQPQAEGSRPGTPRAGPGAVFGLLGDWLAPIHRALSLARQRVGADGARNPVGHAMDWNGMEPRATPWGDDFGSTWSLAMDAEIEAAFDLPKLDGADGFGYSVRGRHTAILRRRYSVPVGILHINENGVRTEE